MRIFEINQNDSGQRLDKFINKVCKALPKPLMYKYIRTKKIKVNDKKCDIAYKLNEGDIVKMYINDEFFENPEKSAAPPPFLTSNVKFDIIYEDTNIILINKPAGIACHSFEKGSNNTLISGVQKYLYRKGEFDPATENSFSPALCNRIDRNTRGIVIAAKNAAALREINEKLKMREIKKYYLCIINGHPKDKQGELRGFIQKDSAENKSKILNAFENGAKEVITRYKVLKEGKNASLVEVELVTGRSHQIRAHFASIGHCLIGDVKYGARVSKNAPSCDGMNHQALMAYKIAFDFAAPSSVMGYLNGKSFEIKDIDTFLEIVT